MIMGMTPPNLRNSTHDHDFRAPNTVIGRLRSA
jgi:hypothetical protein